MGLHSIGDTAIQQTVTAYDYGLGVSEDNNTSAKTVGGPPTTLSPRAYCLEDRTKAVG